MGSRNRTLVVRPVGGGKSFWRDTTADDLAFWDKAFRCGERGNLAKEAYARLLGILGQDATQDALESLKGLLRKASLLPKVEGDPEIVLKDPFVDLNAFGMSYTRAERLPERVRAWAQAIASALGGEMSLGAPEREDFSGLPDLLLSFASFFESCLKAYDGERDPISLRDKGEREFQLFDFIFTMTDDRHVFENCSTILIGGTNYRIELLQDQVPGPMSPKILFLGEEERDSVLDNYFSPSRLETRYRRTRSSRPPLELARRNSHSDS